jgi:saccharopine dehydrogenase-like NADP-dependent oxidoreductase
VERYHDASLGDLDAFLSDGLRTLLGSFPEVRDMEERTLRWPGHFEFMRGLYEAGLLEEEREWTADSTARALGARYPGDAHPDVLLMVIEAERAGKRRAWRLLDRRTDGISSMSRTTGFTTAAVATLLAQRRFREPGVHPPEDIGRDVGLARGLLEDLAAHGVRVEPMT